MKSYISREQDYALRIAAKLGSLKDGNIMSVKELSKKLFISKSFAARIVHKLIQKGIALSKQGHQGGIYLIKPAEEINLFQIIDAIGFKVRFNLCLHSEIDCELSGFCKFHSFFSQQEKNFFEELKKQKLSDFLIINN
jgi:Rrf2 family protein